MCHYLVVESLLEAKEYQEALNILNSIDVDDLIHTISNSTVTKVDQFGFDKSMKNEILAAVSYMRGKVLESMDNRTMAMDCYVQSLQKSVYCTEALDALIQHEMLMAWEERELMQHLPLKQQCSPSEYKIIEQLYESKLKKYYDSVYPNQTTEQTPIGNPGDIRQFLNKVHSENEAPTKSKADSFNTSSRLFTPTMQNIMSPANKYDLFLIYMINFKYVFIL